MSYLYTASKIVGLLPDERIEKVTGPVKGYKAFNRDWTCMEKQYTCPGKFEETGEIELCRHGMHFCPELKDIYSYYSFSSDTKVAEVIATGEIYKDDDGKMVTSNLEIVREVSWTEVNRLLNTGESNIGAHNTGNCNLLTGNSGDHNRGHHNSGSRNIGDRNTGFGNIGDHNAGNYNNGRWNVGDYNVGYNNIGDNNDGSCNIGDFNIGDYNRGVFNVSGISDRDKRKIDMFNKPSEWTMATWKNSKAYAILTSMPKICIPTWFITKNEIAAMDGTEEATSPVFKAKKALEYVGDTYDAVGVLVAGNKSTNEDRQNWWKRLTPSERLCIMRLPNFDKDIFYRFTGIDIYDVDLADPNDESLFDIPYDKSVFYGRYSSNGIIGKYEHPKGDGNDE